MATKVAELDKPYKPGDVIFRSKPYAWCLANRFFDKYCHYCSAPLPYASNPNHEAAHCKNDNKPTTNLIVVDALKCLRCQLAVYCSAECKKRAWCLGGHRKECVVFQAWSKAYRLGEDNQRPSIDSAEQSHNYRSERTVSSSSDEQENKEPRSRNVSGNAVLPTKPPMHWLPHELTRLICRIVIKLAQGISRNTDDASGECECQPETGVAFGDLMSHWSDERENDEESNATLSKVFQHLDDGFPADWHSEREFLKWNRLGEIFGRVMTNAFCIEEYVNLKLIGLSVYLCPAKVDHSCRPNVSYAMHNGNELEMLAIEPIRNFALARTSYLVDLTDPRTLRRYDLRRQWYFVCTCEGGCDSETRERRIAAIQCPYYECGAAMHVSNDELSLLCTSSTKMTCQACKRCDISAFYVREALSVMDEMVAFMKSPKEMLFVSERLLSRITSFVHISNGLMPTYLLTFLDTLQQHDQDIKTVCCIPNKRRLTATLLLLTIESLSQTLDLWPNNYFCHGTTLLRAFRHLHRFVYCSIRLQQSAVKNTDDFISDEAVQAMFSSIADQNNQLLIHAGGVPRRAPGRQLAQKAAQLLSIMQKCLELHFNRQPEGEKFILVNNTKQEVNETANSAHPRVTSQHPVLEELLEKHAPLVKLLGRIFLD